MSTEQVSPALTKEEDYKMGVTTWYFEPMMLTDSEINNISKDFSAAAGLRVKRTSSILEPIHPMVNSYKD